MVKNYLWILVIRPNTYPYAIILTKIWLGWIGYTIKQKMQYLINNEIIKLLPTYLFNYKKYQ